MRETQQESYVLHTRAYRETSSLVDIFSRNHGRVSAVANGARRIKSRFELVAFVRSEAAWSGKAQLKTLTACEGVQYHQVSGKGLLSAMYLNEILMLLMQPFDPHPQLFDGYRTTLEHIANSDRSDKQALEIYLREFEKLLLREIGYEVQFDIEAATGCPIESDGLYQYKSGFGFSLVPPEETPPHDVYAGQLLLNIACKDYRNAATRLAAKKIMRVAIHAHTGGKRLHSRSLFVAEKPGGGKH